MISDARTTFGPFRTPTSMLAVANTVTSHTCVTGKFLSINQHHWCLVDRKGAVGQSSRLGSAWETRARKEDNLLQWIEGKNGKWEKCSRCGVELVESVETIE